MGKHSHFIKHTIPRNIEVQKGRSEGPARRGVSCRGSQTISRVVEFRYLPMRTMFRNWWVKRKRLRGTQNRAGSPFPLRAFGSFLRNPENEDSAHRSSGCLCWLLRVIQHARNCVWSLLKRYFGTGEEKPGRTGSYNRCTARGKGLCWNGVGVWRVWELVRWRKGRE